MRATNQTSMISISFCVRPSTRVSVKDAVAEVAGATGTPRAEVYRRALALKDASDGTPH